MDAGQSTVKIKEPIKQKPAGNPLIRNWEIQLNTWPRKLIAITLVLVTCGTLIYRTWWLFLAAWITRSRTPDPAIYELATKYDPNNADYRFVLAQIYNYSTEYLDLKRAGEEYEAAVRLNPHRWLHWLELSKYYEQMENPERSRYAMKMALERDPNYAQTHWAAANLYIRLNDLTAADFELRRTADLDVAYLTQALDLVWRFYEDPERIMSTHVPNTKDANLTALNYFVSQKSEQGAAIAWNKLTTFETKPPERFAYIEYLVALGKPHAAWEIFSFPAVAPVTPVPAIFNASFESEPMNGGFDWRYASLENAEARRDTTTAKDGLASFLVTFSGKENVDYAHVWHWLPVQKGRSYNLQFWMKTEAISTNEGMSVEVDGQRSEPQLGTTYWQQFKIPFTASSDLVMMRLRRIPTRKFDNLLKGKVWLDAFTLTAVP
jgi:tetratricopeptide (TPR) repeat protein